MQKSDDTNKAVTAHRRVRSSTTLNRKYVKRPEKRITDAVISVKKSSRISRFGSSFMKQQQKKAEQPVAAPKAHPVQIAAINKMREQNARQETQAQPKLTAKELKDQAIKKALASASKTQDSPATVKAQKKAKKTTAKIHFGIGRVLLALSCAAAAVFAIVYFVNLNMPDISLRVAAMQTGFDAKYPGYIPRDYSLSGISSENEKMVLNFKNISTGETFSIQEEQSSWDSGALLSNYVKDTYGENYSVIREQGLTIYVGSSEATWVNGGVLYKMKISPLSKKQIRSIAVSL